MQFISVEPQALEYVATVREILLPAVRQGINLTTSTGQRVTLAQLPALVEQGALIEAIGGNGELVAVTLPDDERPDTRRTHEGRPSFYQIADDGGWTNFWLLSATPTFIAGESYRPAPFATGRPIYGVQRDEMGLIKRIAAKRAPRVFGKRIAREKCGVNDTMA